MSGFANGSDNVSVSREEFLRFLQDQYDLGCEGIYGTQLWMCMESVVNYILGVVSVTVFVLGIVSSIALLLYIPLNKRVRNPFHTVIFYVTFANFVALIATFVNGFISEVIVNFEAAFGSQLFFEVMTSNLAALHALMLCYARYTSLTNWDLSKEDSEEITPKILKFTGLWWLISVIIGVAFTVPVLLILRSADFTNQAEFSEVLKSFHMYSIYFRFYVSGVPMFILLGYFFCFQRKEHYYFLDDYITRRQFKAISLFGFFFVLSCLEEIVFDAIFIIQEKTTLRVLDISEFRFLSSSQVSWIIIYSIFPVMYFIVSIPCKEIKEFCASRFGD